MILRVSALLSLRPKVPHLPHPTIRRTFTHSKHGLSRKPFFYYLGSGSSADCRSWVRYSFANVTIPQENQGTGSTCQGSDLSDLREMAGNDRQRRACLKINMCSRPLSDSLSLGTAGAVCQATRGQEPGRPSVPRGLRQSYLKPVLGQ